MPFWPLCCEREAILSKQFRPGNRARVLRCENQTLGNRASSLSRMNTPQFLQRIKGALYDPG